MIVVDEYLLLRVLSSVGDIKGLPDDTIGLTYLRHWRMVSTIATGNRTGRLSRLLAELDPSRRRFIEQPDARIVQIIDPRALVLSSARAHAASGGLSALMAETVAACLHYGSPFYVGDPQNAKGSLADKMRILGVDIIQL